MQNSLSYRWFVIAFFSIVGMAFLASVVYLAVGNLAPDTYWGRKWKMPRSENNAELRSPDKVILELNKGIRVGNRTFFYRGLQNDQIMLDVIIPELDRQYSYPFRISFQQGKHGFEVAGVNLKLITARSNFASVKLISVVQPPR